MSKQQKDKNGTDCSKRRLMVAAAAVGGSGGIVSVIPFVSSMLPSERAKAAGAPVEVDVAKLKSGELMTIEWQGKPIWILKRTQEMLDTLESHEALLADPKSEKKQPSFQPPKGIKTLTRSLKSEVLVLVGICTHLGCSPSSKLKQGSTEGMPEDWPGGFFCPCHGSTFDLAGRVFKNKPAPDNLHVPPYTYLSENRILVGSDQEGA